MKILKSIIPTARVPWSLKATCGTLKGGPPVQGCSTQVELALEDVFRKTVSNGQMMGYSLHWRCPQCFVTNTVPFDSVPTMDVQSHEKYLGVLREKTMIEIAKCHDFHERADVIEDLGLEHFLNETTVSKVLNNKELYS